MQSAHKVCPWGGGRGVLSFFSSYVGSGPASTLHEGVDRGRGYRDKVGGMGGGGGGIGGRGGGEWG